MIGCLNLVYMASAMTIEQAAEKASSGATTGGKNRSKKGLNRRLFWWPDGEAACIYVDTIEWRKTFRGMA
ncbi:DNA-binding transcriptional activator MhpR [Escherichia coli]|uniref:DNA-binding transcriptional activator MhpR n=1 Tax=Escherichia coli TaxID=562 RepID=A0A377DIR7_ECOLX|nr:DNA-binding transcriptional activator MhpR [Escherichia coli]